MISEDVLSFMHSREGQRQAQAYLSSARQLEALIALRLARLDELRARGERVTRALDGMPGGSGLGDRVGHAAAALADQEELLLEDYHKLLAKQAEIHNTIHHIPRPLQRAVLEMRYLQGLSMIGIAHRLSYDVRQVQRLHHEGLCHVAGQIAIGRIRPEGEQ